MGLGPRVRGVRRERAARQSEARPRRLLFLSTYPPDDASVRQRFLAYEPSLTGAGWQVRHETIITPRLYRMKNEQGRLSILLKIMLLAAGLLRRAMVLLRSRHFAAVWVHREAFPFFAPWPERLLRRITRGRIVFDFDDALYALPPAGRDWRSRLRNPSRFRDSVATADVVMAGSPALIDWAAGNGIRAHYVPTSVDIAAYPVHVASADAQLTIGWIGSWSTTDYLLDVLTPLARASATGSRVLLVGAANLESFARALQGAEWRAWRRDRELADLAEFDVGIMPVPDSEWNRGKCAYKLIQYMALGIPYVASPVGMNVEVTLESGAGLLAREPDEWEEALATLIANPALRNTLGRAGRAYAETHFDTAAWAPTVVALLGHEGPG